MMNFVLGKAGSGKSTHVLNEVKKLSASGKRVYVVVPEQFTFETERKYFDLLSPASIKNVNVTSFTRISHNVFKLYGSVAGEYADEGIKLILMRRALLQIKDELGVYKKAADNIGFATDMLGMVTELKNAGITPPLLEENIKLFPDGLMREKSSDILKAYYIYDGLLAQKYKDNLDDLSRANKMIAEHNYFSDSYVFIDEFKGFTANEMTMIKNMAVQSNDICVSLCLDSDRAYNGSIFDCVDKTYRELKMLAQKNNIRISTPLKLRQNYRFKSDELSFMEQNIFAKRVKKYDGKCENICVSVSANEYDEVDFALSSVCELVQNKGYRYRDIVIVSRELETYKHCLETAFLKYNIPYYMDNPKSIFSNPVYRFVQTLLECTYSSYTSWQLLSILKCGVCGFSFEDISVLENYIFMWDIKGKDWEQEFKLSIFGINKPSDEQAKAKDEEALNKINLIRDKLITCVGNIKTAAKTKNAVSIGEALFKALTDMGVCDAVNQAILKAKAEDSGDAAKIMSIADEYRRVWEIIGQIANKIADVLDNEAVNIKEYAELFDTVASCCDIDTIPQSLDCVTVGSAERIRTDSPKVLFVLGVNDKVFPFVPTAAGLYTDRERNRLLEYDMKLSKPLRDRMLEEKFIAYKTLTLPSDRLYISARNADVKGNAVSLSPIFIRLEGMFGNDIVTDTFDVDKLFFCRTKKSAFSQLAYNFRLDNRLLASLEQYFSNDDEYAQKIKSLSLSQNCAEFKLNNKEDIKKLYGDSVYMSPTGVEKFYQCKFAYFCKNGLLIKPRQRVELNGLNKGLIIHELLYKILSEVKDFNTFDEAKIKGSIKTNLKQYLNENMAGEKAYSKRFLYLYSRLEKLIFQVVKSVFDELRQSLFVPRDFEYDISSQNDIRPLKLKSDGGIPIKIRGVIDRIDTYTAPNGQKYVRVIDYKSGSKKFKLSDIVNGVNLQMFIYLMCIQESAVKSYDNMLGAGVLYVPAGEMTERFEREAPQKTSDNQIKKHYKRFGVILDDADIIKAMEQNLDGTFTPLAVKASAYDKNHEIKKDVFKDNKANEEHFSTLSIQSLLTSEQLGKLFNKIKRLVKQMVNELYDGRIEAIPLETAGSMMCDYCEYKNACRHDENAPVRKYRSMDKKEIFELIKEEDNVAEN